MSSGNELAVRGILTPQLSVDDSTELALVRSGKRPPLHVVIVGSGPLAFRLLQDISQWHSRQYHVLGFIDNPDGHVVPQEIQARLLGPIETLDEILLRHVVDLVLIAMPIKSCYDQIQQAIGACEKAGVESEYFSQPFAVSLARPMHANWHSHPVVRFKVVDDDFRLKVKRLIDIIGALLGLVLLAPLMILIAAAVAFTTDGPILYRQERFGFRKRRFHMFKFRTMVREADALQSSLEERNEKSGPIFKIKNDPRITPIGRFLRLSSLDELPQLFNVVLGDMSLVGPRPMSVRDVLRFDEPWLMRRFSVRPGMTCLWQVSGRSDTTFERWIELDLEYIDSWSLMLDLSILAQTVPAVLRCQGAA